MTDPIEALGVLPRHLPRPVHAPVVASETGPELDSGASALDPAHNPTPVSIPYPDLVSQAQALILCAVSQAGLSKSEIARRLGLHHSTVCDTLQSGRNLTIKNLERMLRVCGFGVRFKLYELGDTKDAKTEGNTQC